VIKMVLAAREGLLPQTLHITTPTTHVDWEQDQIRLLQQARQWPNRADQPRRAAVSSFGISGTNAHLILEQAPQPALTNTATSVEASPSLPLVPITLSARDQVSLAAQAARLTDHLTTHPDLPLHDLALSAATTRAHLEQRAVILAATPDDLHQALRHLTTTNGKGSGNGTGGGSDVGANTATVNGGTNESNGEGTGVDSPNGLPTRSSNGSNGSNAWTNVNLITGRAKPGKIAFLYSGQGAQHPGMGRQLYETFPTFAHALNNTCDALDPHLDHPLRDIMWATPNTHHAQLLHQTTYTQPALFALQTALTHLLTHWGIHPHYLAGHSLGEITAAHTAGILTLTDAA
ncbi:acyltransferase domain-containing protein, partial [Nonomuraea sp. NPDC050153]|uniref:acyltransferase domain-containing protein n=1 Tax=Nonomuraea sp. NPDC050153 TaxID=3364359 RepID=UPI0037916EEF